jgi:hypothetical protein
MGWSEKSMLDEPEQALDASGREVVDDVRKYGFHITSVAWSEADREADPSWAHVGGWLYTIGFLATWDFPEVAVFSLPYKSSAQVVWDIAHLLEAGTRLEADRVHAGVLESFGDQSFVLEAVHPTWIADFFGAAQWFYRDAEFPVLQYLWPDRDGRFAWDEGMNADVAAAQFDLRVPQQAEGAPPGFR